MEYRKFGNKIVARIDRGEEVLSKLKEISEKEGIKLASVTALGATGDFTVGLYNVDEQKYYKNNFKGDFEIVSLTGTVNTLNGEFYSHLHMSAADKSGAVFGGHLNEAVISATCEMVITLIDGEVDRVKDSVTGLNIFDFQKK